MADRSAAEAGAATELQRALDGARFPLRLRGYDPVEVDDLLDHLATLVAPTHPCSPGGTAMSIDPFPAPEALEAGGADIAWSRPSFADRTFRTVLRGWDPKEVRAYLEELDRLYGQGAPGAIDADSERRARDLVAAARAEADLIVSAARREVDGLEAERDAVLGRLAGNVPDERDLALAQFDAEQIRTAARAEADRIVADAQEQAEALVASPPASRWEEAGAHVARVLEHADLEAAAILQAAEAEARVQVTEAEVLRNEAATMRREASAEAERLVAEARVEAQTVRDAAVPRARAHIGEVLALAHDELDAARGHLARTVAELRTVQQGVERSLAEVGDLPELATVDDLVVPEVAAPSMPAGPDPVASVELPEPVPSWPGGAVSTPGG